MLSLVTHIRTFNFSLGLNRIGASSFLAYAKSIILILTSSPSKLVHRSRLPRDPAPSFSPSSTTSPLTRKRKATQTAEEVNKPVKATKLSKDLSKDFPTASSRTALNTPPLTTMDSDDEFMSGLSSQDEDDFGGAQESDDGSLGDGTCSHRGVILPGWPTDLDNRVR